MIIRIIQRDAIITKMTVNVIVDFGIHLHQYLTFYVTFDQSANLCS